MSKKYFSRHLFSAIVFLMIFLGFPGCNNLTGGNNKSSDDNDGKVYLKVNVASASRTALPQFTVSSISDFQFTIKGKAPGTSDFAPLTTESNTNGVYSSLTALTSAAFPIETGAWTFKLTASKDGTVLSDEVSQTIKNGSNSISFDLKWDDTELSGTGSLSFTLDFSNAANKDDVKVVTAALVNTGTNTTTCPETEILDRGDTPSVYTATYSSATLPALANIAAGKYRIFLRLYTVDTSTNTNVLINTWTELAIITGGQASTGSSEMNSLNEIYSINWNIGDGVSSVTMPECYTRLSADYDLPDADDMTKLGYTFGGWYESDSFTGGAITSISADSTGNKTFYAKWNANTNTPYTIKHWKQRLEAAGTEHNETNYELAATDNLTGTTDTEVTPVAKDTTTGDFLGFTAPGSTELSQLKANIAPDDSTEINLYYTRNSYSVTYKDGLGNTIGTSESYLYGATVNVDFANAPTRAGNLFNGWDDGNGGTYTSDGTTTFEMGTSNVVLNATWTEFYILVDGTNYTDVSSAYSAIRNASSTADITVTLSNIPASELGLANEENITIIYAIKNTSAKSVSLIVPPGQTITLSGPCSYMFNGCEKLVHADLRGFDLSGASEIYSMFYNCSGLRTVDVSSFDISKFSSIMFMFNGCSSLEEIDVSNFNTNGNAYGCKFHGMFYGCSSLTSVDLSNFDTSKSDTFTSLFYGCTNLVSVNLSSFTIKDSTVQASCMFGECSNLETIIVPENFDLSVLSNDFSDMFKGCVKLKGGNNTTFDDTKTDNTYARPDKPGSPGYFTSTGFTEIKGTNGEKTFYASTALEWDESTQKGSKRFISGRTIAIPAMSVCVHEVTQGEYEQYCTYSSADVPVTDEYTGKGADYPAYYVSWYDALVYCNLRSMVEGYEPVYAIGGQTDPTKWPDIISDDSTGVLKYAGKGATTNDATWDAVTMVGSDPSNYIVTTANGYRLPTADEWEYIARECNIDNTSQFIYSGTDNPANYAWYREHDYKMHEVMGLSPNSLGIYDMNGNVNEWCWDWLNIFNFEDTTPITGPESCPNNTRCDSGGCWYSYLESGNISLGNAAEPNGPYVRNYGIGFRVVRSK